MAAPNQSPDDNQDGWLPVDGNPSDTTHAQGPQEHDGDFAVYHQQAWGFPSDSTFRMHSEHPAPHFPAAGSHPAHHQPGGFHSSGSGRMGGFPPVALQSMLPTQPSHQALSMPGMTAFGVDSPTQQYQHTVALTTPLQFGQHEATISQASAFANPTTHLSSTDVDNVVSTGGWSTDTQATPDAMHEPNVANNMVDMPSNTSVPWKMRSLACKGSLPGEPPSVANLPVPDPSVANPSDADPSDANPSDVDPQALGSGFCIGKTKRKKFDDDGREKVKRVRTSGACIRCRRYKLSCDSELPCRNCTKVLMSVKIYRGPCINPRLDDVQAFRSGDGDNRTTKLEMPVLKWKKQGRTRPIQVHWPFESATSTSWPTLSIVVEEFEPGLVPPDEEWLANGMRRRVSLKPWACRDARTVEINMRKFVRRCQGLLEGEISHMHKQKHPIMSLMWEECLRFRNETPSAMGISKAMELYTCAVMNTRYLGSLDAHTFKVGSKEIDDPPAYFDVGGPLPNQLTCQLQTMIAMMQSELQLCSIKALKRMVFSKNRRAMWLEALLTMFVILSTIELVYQTQARFMAYKNSDNVSYVTRWMNEKWEESFDNLTAHFQHVMDGNRPLGRDFPVVDELGATDKRPGLSDRQVAFVYHLKDKISSQGYQSVLKAARKTRSIAPSGSRLSEPLSAICELFLQDEPGH